MTPPVLSKATMVALSPSATYNTPPEYATPVG